MFHAFWIFWKWTIILWIQIGVVPGPQVYNIMGKLNYKAKGIIKYII